MNRKIRRVAVLFSRLSGYMAACLRTLSDEHHVELLVFRRPPSANAPFDESQFDWISEDNDATAATEETIMEALEAFEPDAIFMVGWADKRYLKVARKMRKKGVPVVAGSDAQWEGSLKQFVGVLMAPRYLHSAIDVLWVAGERQRQFAHKLGFRGAKCWMGYYACDWSTFATGAKEHDHPAMHSFLYVGRYEPVKGIDILTKGYSIYRTQTHHPWPLHCIGAGSLQGLLNKEGIIDQGFVQPTDLPARMARASAFVLPSRREPWGVVVQEASAAGLPLVCSDASGAAVHLVQDGYNGFMFENGNAQHLAECLLKISEMDAPDRESMSRRSVELSKQYTPGRWADTLVQGVLRWKSRG